MRLFIELSRKKLVVIFAVMVTVVLISGEFYAVSITRKNGETNAERVAFAESLNIKVVPECESVKEINIPYEFSDVYKNYNLIQKKAGYDLEKYKGSKAVLYTYEITGMSGKFENCKIHLIVYKGEVIGGDIASDEINGFMIPLKRC